MSEAEGLWDIKLGYFLTEVLISLCNILQEGCQNICFFSLQEAFNNREYYVKCLVPDLNVGLRHSLIDLQTVFAKYIEVASSM